MYKKTCNIKLIRLQLIRYVCLENVFADFCQLNQQVSQTMAGWRLLRV